MSEISFNFQFCVSKLQILCVIKSFNFYLEKNDSWSINIKFNILFSLIIKNISNRLKIYESMGHKFESFKKNILNTFKSVWPFSFSEKENFRNLMKIKLGV